MDYGSPKESKQVKEKSVEKSAKLSYQEEKELKRKRTKYQNQSKKAEEEIERIEARIQELDEILADFDYSKEEEASKLSAEYEDLQTELGRQMNLWEEASLELEKL